MNKKIIIGTVLAIIVVVAIVSVIIVLNQNKVKTHLDGMYVTDKIEYMKTGEKSTVSTIMCMYFYNNGSVSSTQITITDVEEIGTTVKIGTPVSGTYTLSNESKTILLNIGTVSRTMSFENEYKTLKENGVVYNLTNKTMDEIAPKDTLNDSRDTGFAGLYRYDSVEYERTPRSTHTYKGKPIEKEIRRTEYEFKTDGTLQTRKMALNIYNDGTEEILNKNEFNEIYNYDKENGKIYTYSKEGVPGEKIKINDELNTITNASNVEHKLVEQ